jgi:cholesterol 7-dehydrogenase
MEQPHPYPNGWYRVADSEELRPGESLAVRLCDSDLALFRSDVTGEVGALDGHCVHQGAALGGGRVKDGCLECPFHQWAYDTTGRVRRIPYAKRVPGKLAVPTWPVREIDGQIFVWHAIHGDHLQPSYELDPDPGIASGAMLYRGHYDAGEVAMTVFDFAENGPDTQHFAVVHRRVHIPWTHITIPGFQAYVRPNWHLDERRAHVAWLETWGTLRIFGRLIEGAGATANVEFIGPGSVARFHFEREDIGRLVLYQTHTPIGERLVRVRFRWYAEPRVPRPLIWYVVGHWVSQWREDVRIWRTKIFREKPALVAEDGPVLEMRRWFRQFYGQPALAAVRGDDTLVGESEGIP